MTLLIRRILAVTFSLIFIILSAGFILYSNGWRLNTQNFKIQKTGGVFIKSVPKDAEIKIDDKLVKNKSGLFQEGTLISNLLPQSYKVTVEKNGYYPWKNDLTIYQSLVTEAKNIVLVPQNIGTPIEKNTSWFNIENNKIASKNNSGELYFDDTKLPGNDLIGWSSDNLSVINRNQKSGTYFLTNTEDGSSLNLSIFFQNLKERDPQSKIATNIKDLYAHPFDSQKIIVRDNHQTAYILDTKKVSLEKIKLSTTQTSSLEIQNVLVKDNEIIFGLSSATSSSLYAYDFIIKSTSKIASNIPGKIVKLVSSDPGDKIGILENNGALYLLNRGDLTISKIADNIRDFSFSPDNQKVGMIDTSNNLKIYFNGKRFEGKTQLRQLALDNQGEITGFTWYKDSVHLFISYDNNAIYLVEFNEPQPESIFDNNKIMMFELISNNVRQSFYDKTLNILYLLKNNSLYKIKFDN